MPSKILDALPKITWGFFFATVVLLPFRFRWLLLARPEDLIWRDYTDFLLFASDVTLIFCLVFWLGDVIVRREKINTGPFIITFPLVGLTITALLTSFSSLDPLLSLYHSIRLIILFGFYLYVVNHVRSIKQLVAPLSIMVAVQAIVAIVQALTQKSVGLPQLGEYPLDPAWSGISVVWTSTMRSLRAYGLSDHPNVLGGCLAFGILLLFTWYVYNESRWEVLAASVLTAGLIALLVTFSRSAWMGSILGASFLAFQLLSLKGRNSIHRSVALLGAAALLLTPFVWKNSELLGVRLGAGGSFEQLPGEVGSLGERRVLMGVANQVFSQNALLGVGLAASPLAFKEEFPDMTVNFQPAHVVILTAAVETGLFGALFYLFLLTAPWVAMYVNRKIKKTPDLIAAFAILLLLTAIGFFDYYTWLLVPGRLLQYMGWGMWASFYVQGNLER